MVQISDPNQSVFSHHKLVWKLDLSKSSARVDYTKLFKDDARFLFFFVHTFTF